MLPNTTSNSINPDVHKIEFTGVFQCGCNRVNHFGNRSSQPTAIGNRVTPVNR